jgi:hypothetical protein
VDVLFLLSFSPFSLDVLALEQHMTANPAPDPPPAPVYDCFISYRSARFDWVETLARNLLTQGLRVFLDRWELVPGVDHASQLATALGRSRAGVLVASPDTVDSEWVRNEWNRMLANRHADRTGGAERPFPIIPLLLGPIPELPFASNYHSIDFSAVTDEAGYRRAFAVLLKALAGEPPGPAPHHDGPLILPPGLAAHRPPAPSQLGAIDQAAVQLRLAHLVAILAQAHYPLGRLADALARRLRDDLSAPPAEDRVLRLAPLNDPGIDAPAYFGHLATQAGLPAQGIDSAGAWRHALEVRFPHVPPRLPSPWWCRTSTRAPAPRDATWPARCGPWPARGGRGSPCSAACTWPSRSTKTRCIPCSAASRW